VYGSVGGSGLADHLDLRITRGSIPGGGAEDCTGFTPDGAAHLGQGHDPGVVYDSTLSAFPTSWTGAREDPDGTDTGHWLPGDTHAYRFTLTLRGEDAGAGLHGRAYLRRRGTQRLAARAELGQTLHNGVTLRSSQTGNVLMMQSDGNLVLYDSHMTPLWYTSTSGYGPTVELQFQPDGNLVLTGQGVGTIGQTGTAGSGASTLVLRPDGHLELRRADGTPLLTI